MRVTGTLSPDVTGDFIRGANYDGHDTWTLEAGGWSIWYHTMSLTYYVTPIIGTIPQPPDPYWMQTTGYQPAPGPYTPQGTATGVATVTSI